MTKQGFDINELRLGPGLIMGLVSFSAAIVLDIYLLPNKGKIVGFSVLASLACIYTARPMLRYAGAKAFIIGYVVLHLALIFVPLTDSDFPGPVLVPFFIADYVAMVFGLRLCTVPTMEQRRPFRTLASRLQQRPMPAWAALLGMIVSATMMVLSARANREAKATGRLRFLFWHLRGWSERESNPRFFRVALGFDQYRTFFFSVLTIVFSAYFLEAVGLIYQTRRQLTNPAAIPDWHVRQRFRLKMAGSRRSARDSFRPIADIPYGSPWRYRPRMTFRRAIFLLAIGVAIGVIVALGGR